jgi:hypothetical protein
LTGAPHQILELFTLTDLKLSACTLFENNKNGRHRIVNETTVAWGCDATINQQLQNHK